MAQPPNIDGILITWGDRLFYGSNRIVRNSTPRLSLHAQAGAVRQRIKAIVMRNAPQVMVKVTGGGRGMAAIAAHLRYISKSGRLPFEDDRGGVRQGSEALRDLADQWRCGGARIPERSERREAFNIMLAMPAVLYQVWAFVAPGLYRKEKRLAVPLLVSSVVLFYAGVAFA